MQSLIYKLIKPGKSVKKHNKLVRGRVKVSNSTCSRILAVLIACIKENDTDLAESYSVAIKDYLPDEGGVYYTLVRNACDKLIESSVEVEMIEDDGKPSLDFRSFFTQIKYKDGIVTARFNPLLQEFLVGLKRNFTQVSLKEYLALSSSYTRTLFELLSSWQRLPSGEYVENIEKLHFLLGTVRYAPR